MLGSTFVTFRRRARIAVAEVDVVLKRRADADGVVGVCWLTGWGRHSHGKYKYQVTAYPDTKVQYKSCTAGNLPAKRQPYSLSNVYCPRFALVALATFAALSFPVLLDMLGTASTSIPNGNWYWDRAEPTAEPASAQPSPQITQSLDWHPGLSRMNISQMCAGTVCATHAHCEGEGRCACDDGYVGDGRIWCVEDTDPNRTKLRRMNATEMQRAIEQRGNWFLQLSPKVAVVLYIDGTSPTTSINCSSKLTAFTAEILAKKELSLLTCAPHSLAELDIPHSLRQHKYKRHMTGDWTTFGMLISAPLKGHELPPWTVIVPIQEVCSGDVAADSVVQYINALAMMNASVPMWFGRPAFNASLRSRRGEAFPAIEAQSWLPICGRRHLSVYSAAFTSMMMHSGRQPVGREWRGPNVAYAKHGLATRKCSFRKEGISNADFATCMYEHFGIRCGHIEQLYATKDVEGGTKEWGDMGRHTQWNCSITLQGPQPNESHTVTAVCQNPIRAAKLTGTANTKRTVSPNSTGNLYREILQPEEFLQADVESHKIVNIGWIASTKKTGSSRPSKVVYAPGEPRDAVFVVGAGSSIDVPPVEVFIRSLRSTGSRAEIVFFADARCVNSFIPLAVRYGGVRLLQFDAEALGKLYRSSKPVVIYRFVLYEHFLRQHSGVYRRCLHADLFDTYFQRDPFNAVELRDGIAVFTENPAVELALCRYHRYWFQQCKERQMLHKYHSIARVCMGIVMGEYESFITFLEMTLFRMLRYCNDQGVLNMLTWSGQYAEVMPVTVYTAQRGPVFHANTEIDFEYDEKDGFIVNTHNQPFAMIHQWDRLLKLDVITGMFRVMKGGAVKRRRKWVEHYWFQPKFSWNRSKLVPQCDTTFDGASILCTTGSNTRHGSMHAVFCPTHTMITSVNESHASLASDWKHSSFVREVLISPFLLCTSTQLSTLCAGQMWCEIARKHIDRAVRICKKLQPADSAQKPIDSVSNSILYACHT